MNNHEAIDAEVKGLVSEMSGHLETLVSKTANADPEDTRYWASLMILHLMGLHGDIKAVIGSTLMALAAESVGQILSEAGIHDAPHDDPQDDPYAWPYDDDPDDGMAELWAAIFAQDTGDDD